MLSRSAIRWGVGPLIFLLAAAVFAAPRPGLVQFSDGAVVEGLISQADAAPLKIHDGDTLRTIELGRVCEIRFTPEKESMERAWRFVEAGRTEKEFMGEPYPVRALRASLRLADGGNVSGHLYTMPLLIEVSNRTQNVVLRAKQRGKEGQTLDELAYPSRVAFADPAGEAGPAVAIHIAAAESGQPSELVALTFDALIRLAATRGNTPSAFNLPSPLGARVFLAARSNGQIRVGWPAEKDTNTEARILAAMPAVRDFFDNRKLLGVYHDTANRNIYTLFLLTRTGRTTLDADASQPWRLDLWRWKENDEGALMLAGRGTFYRGAVARRFEDAHENEKSDVLRNLPAVQLDETLWDPDLKR